MVQRPFSMPTRMTGSQQNILSPRSPRQNMSRSSENINETSIDTAKSGLRNTVVKPMKPSKFVPVANGTCSPREKVQSFFNRTRSRKL